MKIGIVGSRGIPNQYGGFEQFVEYVAPVLVSHGHQVYVYNSSLHPYKEPTWKGVNIITRSDPENRVGTAGQFIYDLNCILDSRKRNFDIILQLGYTSSSIWTFLYPRKSILVTNMDGLEWKRTKYSKPVRRFLQFAEKWAALHSDALIADSRGIQEYLQTKYNKQSDFIAYGATPFDQPERAILDEFGVTQYAYDLVIARMEPENNIETIIQGHLQADKKTELIIIGGYSNKYGSQLRAKYESAVIRFAGPVYDIHKLNSLRYFARFYFHGHSVGGTNPSLLEAMASQALIVAHNNIFNESVLGNDAFYFSSPREIARLLDSPEGKPSHAALMQRNLSKIRDEYSWNYIANRLENFLLASLKKREDKSRFRS